jgi:hypothetical protein
MTTTLKYLEALNIIRFLLKPLEVRIVSCSICIYIVMIRLYSYEYPIFTQFENF